MDEINIMALRELAADKSNVVISKHAYSRIYERKISTKDVISGIASGEIIEQYPTDFPFPSCLVLGLTSNGEKIHVVCSIGNGALWIISAYIPTLDKWENDYKTRKAVK